nr:RNA-directed DNA polymerase, eukaryota [Tanacetum cinerariifolium]
MNAGSFKGIRIDDHLTLSYIFYADDAVFIGKWNKENVITIVYMLKCFFLALRLKINIHKSKLMGIGTTQEEVNSAANIIGCNTFSTLFNYLGVKVGTSNSRSRSQETSLWSRFIKAVYGDQGSLVNPGSVARSSPWINITRELGSLSLKGIDLFSQMKKKVEPRVEVWKKSSFVDKVDSVIHSNSNDRWVWSLDSSGEFLVKSTRSFIDDSLLPTV